MRLSGNGRSGSTRGSDAGNMRRCTGWGASPAAIPTCSSCGGRACGRRLECRSRMRRESHVRFWEGGGVQVPSATPLVQDLVLRVRCTRYRRERWLTPAGQLVVAPLPSGVDRHFGPELRRFVLAQYHQGQVTVPRLVAQLRTIGLAISTRQVMRLLIEGQQRFLDEARDVLRAGLTQAAWITVDDTGARHKAANGTCTQIGNDLFAWFGTPASKSRLNFLELLRAGHSEYVINAEALTYMRDRALSGPVIERLATHPEHTFPDRAAWQAHLERLGITDLKVNPDPVRIATEGALWGAIKAHGFLPETVI